MDNNDHMKPDTKSPAPRDGDYYRSPDGGGWRLYRVADGRIVTFTDESNMGSHDAARDHFAGDYPDWDSLEEASPGERAMVAAFEEIEEEDLERWMDANAIYYAG